ncbi:DUF3572 domain-containing protein [Aureimonas frigidaquae]|uniref:DUF3572 family protein n=1 Tax=Aureimonas frigidaquae TaxID=424757 RepID=A0A0P0Z454_9HYPH|nr:DUF3572 domain-containing protein [Aureimonas frigidaquae]BAT28918.1 hypothetical protein [Aureimonas frigidaquae]
MLDKQARPRSMNVDAAEGLAIDALGFLAAHEDEFLRFLALSGLTVGELRAAAGDGNFLAGVLDFVMGNERTLLSFAAHAGIDPSRVGAARQALAGAYGVSAE